MTLVFAAGALSRSSSSSSSRVLSSAVAAAAANRSCLASSSPPSSAPAASSPSGRCAPRSPSSPSFRHLVDRRSPLSHRALIRSSAVGAERFERRFASMAGSISRRSTQSIGGRITGGGYGLSTSENISTARSRAAQSGKPPLRSPTATSRPPPAPSDAPAETATALLICPLVGGCLLL